MLRHATSCAVSLASLFRQFSKPLACDRTLEVDRPGLDTEDMDDMDDMVRFAPHNCGFMLQHGANEPSCICCICCIAWFMAGLELTRKMAPFLPGRDSQRPETAAPKSMGHQCRMFATECPKQIQKGTAFFQQKTL